MYLTKLPIRDFMYGVVCPVVVMLICMICIRICSTLANITSDRSIRNVGFVLRWTCTVAVPTNAEKNSI
jgi:hypothetical protein